MGAITGMIISLGICLVLPVLIVWLVTRYLINRDNKQIELMTEAIKLNPNIDTNKLLGNLKKPEYTLKERVIRKLLRGSIFTFLGIGLVIIDTVMICIGNESHLIDIYLNLYILAAVFLSVGIGFLIAWKASKNQLDEEKIEKED